MKKHDSVQNIERFETDPHQGLSSEQVLSREQQHLVNKVTKTVGKTYFQIVLNDVFSPFNIVYFVIGILLIMAKMYDSLFFFFVIIPNILISLYEDIKARKLMDKLSLMTAPKAHVIRNGESSVIDVDKVVLDDIITYETSMQICADGIVLEGEVGVNESQLTGESDTIYKKPGDYIYSGSYVVTGKCFVRVDKIGNDSYVQSIQEKARKFKRSKSEIMTSLNKIFKYLSIIIGIIVILTLVVYIIQGHLSTYDNFIGVIGPLAGSIIPMIPAGLYLLTSVALAVAVISLAQKNAQVQDFYSVEMLARSNVLCIDKTGTITDGNMTVKEIVPIDDLSVKHVTDIIGSLIHATGDNNATAEALKKLAYSPLFQKADIILPFNSENKYSAATFGDTTYVLGAPELLNINHQELIKNKCEVYTSKGFRVLIIASVKKPIENKKIEGFADAFAIIVLQDHIKDDAPEIFSWFQNNSVEIKVISGDNAITTSEIARTAGINNAEKYISLEGMSLEEVKEVAGEYSIFGRVTPEQKAAIVEALQEKGKTVAMTGDGVNDIVALKKSDCSIAMASGSEATRNISHIVMLDSNFSSLPSVVAEGRRVVNNLQRTAALFLVKTAFAIFFSLFFVLLQLFTRDPSNIFPFRTNHLYIWELLGIGLSSFFLTLEGNPSIIEGRFLPNIFKKVIPSAVVVIGSVGAMLIMYYLQKNNIVYTGIGDIDIFVSMSSIVLSLLGLFTLYKICSPFSKYRLTVFIVDAVITVAALVMFYFISCNNSGGGQATILKISFEKLSWQNLMTMVVITVISLAVFLAIDYIINNYKRKEK